MHYVPLATYRGLTRPSSPIISAQRASAHVPDDGVYRIADTVLVTLQGPAALPIPRTSTRSSFMNSAPPRYPGAGPFASLCRPPPSAARADGGRHGGRHLRPLLLIPGDPAAVLLGQEASPKHRQPAQHARARRSLVSCGSDATSPPCSRATWAARSSRTSRSPRSSPAASARPSSSPSPR